MAPNPRRRLELDPGLPADRRRHRGARHRRFGDQLRAGESASARRHARDDQPVVGAVLCLLGLRADVLRRRRGEERPPDDPAGRRPGRRGGDGDLHRRIGGASLRAAGWRPQRTQRHRGCGRDERGPAGPGRSGRLHGGTRRPRSARRRQCVVRRLGPRAVCRRRRRRAAAVVRPARRPRHAACGPRHAVHRVRADLSRQRLHLGDRRSHVHPGGVRHHGQPDDPDLLRAVPLSLRRAGATAPRSRGSGWARRATIAWRTGGTVADRGRGIPGHGDLAGAALRAAGRYGERDQLRSEPDRTGRDRAGSRLGALLVQRARQRAADAPATLPTDAGAEAPAYCPTPHRTHRPPTHRPTRTHRPIRPGAA